MFRWAEAWQKCSFDLKGILTKKIYWKKKTQRRAPCATVRLEPEKVKKIREERPLLSSYHWSSWICTGRPVSLLKSWLFLAVAACWNKKTGRDIGRFSREANKPSPPQMGKHRFHHGVLDGFSPQKKGGPRKWIWKLRNFAETETGLGKRKNHQKPESHTFFFKAKTSFGRCAWAHHTAWSPWSSRKRCDNFEEVSILGARFIGFSEKHREKHQSLLGVHHFEIDTSLMESFFRGLSDLLRLRRHDDCWKCWPLSRISLLDVLSFC